MASERVVWKETTVEVATKGGMKPTRAMVHPAAPGLAITDRVMGEFVVTHVGSGKQVLGPYERMGNAMLNAAQLARCFDWSQDAAGVVAQLDAHGDEPAPLEGCTMTSGGVTRPMTKREVLESARNWIGGLDEFPSEDRHPGAESLQILCPDAEVPHVG